MKPGDIIGPFELGPILGRGGMATVYRGSHLADRTPVAIKVLLPELATQGARLRGFAQEIRGAASLLHPRITTVFDHGRLTEAEAVGAAPAGTPWLAMELVEGGNLCPLAGRLPWATVSRILLDVLDALAHAHARRLVHRDIKLANVLLDRHTQRVKLTDFGLVQSVGTVQALEELGLKEVQGTPSYMAPEQFEGDTASIGPWSDLYGVGAVAWTLTCGAPPYTGSTVDKYRQHRAGVLPHFRPSMAVPPDLLAWIARAMAPEPAKRFRCAADAAWALRQLQPPQSGIGLVPHSALLGLDELEAETRTYAELSLPSSAPAPLEEAPALHAPRPLAPSQPPPCPVDWRVPRSGLRHLHGAGLALYNLRERGVVGREAERDRLWTHLRAVVEDGARRAVVLEGTSGIGKSTLAEWLARTAEEVGAAQWLCIRHTPTDGHRVGVRAMLRAHLRLMGEARAEVDRVHTHLRGLDMPELEEAVGVMQLARSEDGRSDSFGVAVHFSSAAERHRLLARVLAATARERPLVLWLEDVHWDLDALGLVETVLGLDEAAPVLVVCTAATEAIHDAPPLQDCLASLAEQPDVERIELQALPSDVGALLVQDLLGLEVDLVSVVGERCGGNPRFAVQLVADWVDRGLLVPAREGFRLRKDASAALPDTMLHIWRTRRARVLDDLPPARTAAVEIGALLGHEVVQDEWKDALRLAGVSPDEALMEELQRRRLILLHADGRGWSFVHALFREAVLEWIEAQGRRRHWAGLCAEALADSRSHLARRARLLVEAGLAEEALEPLGEAVLHELDRTGVGEARQLLNLRQEILSKLTVAPESRHAYVTELLDVLVLPTADQRAALRELGAHLQARARHFGDWESVVRLMLTDGVQQYLCGDIEGSLARFEEALVVARDHRCRKVVSAAGRVAFLAFRIGDTTRGYEAAREMMFYAEALGDHRRVGHAYLRMSEVVRERGQLQRALFLLEEAEVRLVRVGDRVGLADVYGARGELARGMGDLEAAERAYTESLRRFRMVGGRHLIGVGLNLALTHLQMGRVDEARAWLDSVVHCPEGERAARGVSAVLLAAARLCWVNCLAHSGEWDELVRELGVTVSELETLGIVSTDVVMVAMSTATLCRDAGRLAEARTLLAIAEAQARTMDPIDGLEALAASLR